MAETRQFDEYVKGRLAAWGREFRISDRYGRLGGGKHILQRLIEHRGELPERNVGYKPLTIPLEPLEIEDIVRSIHAELPEVAAVLRAAYGGYGRVAVERVRIAAVLVGHKITRRQFYALHDIGFHRVAGALMRAARAA